MRKTQISSQISKAPKVEQRKFPRILFSKAVFWCQQSNHTYSVLDLSLGGGSFHIPLAHEFVIAVGKKLDGFLKFQDEKIPISIQITRRNVGVFGGSFLKSSSVAKSTLKKWLKPHLAERSFQLLPLPQNMQKGIWYHHPLGTELCFYLSSSQKKPTGFTFWSQNKWLEKSNTRKHLLTGCYELGDMDLMSNQLVTLEACTVTEDLHLDQKKLNFFQLLLKEASIRSFWKNWALEVIQKKIPN